MEGNYDGDNEPNNDHWMKQVLSKAFPNSIIESFHIVGNPISQANAEGTNVQVTLLPNDSEFLSDSVDGDSIVDNNNERHDSSDRKTMTVFVKRIEAGKYASKKTWTDLRRTLIYARTEIRFYKNFVPMLSSPSSSLTHQSQESAVIHSYLADYNLDGLIGEQESATGVDNSPVDKSVPTKDRGGTLVLQSLQPSLDSNKSSGYYQKSPLSVSEAKKCLVALAMKLHAPTWENQSILQLASTQLAPFGGSYHLQIRNPKELAGLVTSWEKFFTAFENTTEMSEFLQQASTDNNSNIRDLGKRVFDVANYVCQELSPSYNEKYATLVHGDYKAMNVFLPNAPSNESKTSSREVKIIDFASTGIGIGMSDVAFHITHALKADDVIKNEDKLIEAYMEALASNNINYPYKEAIRHYQFATVDYFRFILGRFWKNATPESFEAKKNSSNTVLVNRDIDAAIAFISRVDKYLTIIEQEIKTKKERK